LESFRSVLAWAERILGNIDNNRLDALILLSHITSFSKEKIIFNPDFKLNYDQKEKFFELVERRVKHEPISHLIGKREFFGADFSVSKDVLDPRPDSEILIEAILKKFPDRNQKLKIVELGVGSGCLIITLLTAFKSACGTGIDISNAALEICKKNAAKFGITKRLTLLKSNLFNQIPNNEARSTKHEARKFDLIISNPPYIPSDDIKNLQPEIVLFEPRIALDGGKDGLDFYHKIAAKAEKFLNQNGTVANPQFLPFLNAMSPCKSRVQTLQKVDLLHGQNGKIFLEIGYGQKEKVIEIFTKKGFLFIEASLDLAGITRVLEFSC